MLTYIVPWKKLQVIHALEHCQNQAILMRHVAFENSCSGGCLMKLKAWKLLLGKSSFTSRHFLLKIHAPLLILTATQSIHTDCKPAVPSVWKRWCVFLMREVSVVISAINIQPLLMNLKWVTAFLYGQRTWLEAIKAFLARELTQTNRVFCR